MIDSIFMIGYIINKHNQVNNYDGVYKQIFAYVLYKKIFVYIACDFCRIFFFFYFFLLTVFFVFCVSHKESFAYVLLAYKG